MNDFDIKRLKSLDYYDPNKEIENWLGAGREFSQLLPSHTLKAYKLFLQIEHDLFEETSANVLDQPILSILDNGCGGGSITIGLLSLILNYQKYKLTNLLPLYPVKVNCFGLDPNVMVLQIYKKFADECASKVGKYLIDIDTQILPGTLPDHVGEVTKWMGDQKRLHSFIVGFGNVIRPIKREYEQTRKILGLFRINTNIFGGYASSIGFREITALESLISNSAIDKLIIPIIGSDSTDKNGTKNWDEEIRSFQNNIVKSVSKHRLSSEKQKRILISVLGPKSSFFRKIRNEHAAFSTEFAAAYSIIENTNFGSDKDWLNILSEENLLLAWARVRNELSYFNVEDTVEIRLFELNIQERVRKLRQDILTYRWKSLNISEMLNFFAPKGENKNPRPLNLCRLEEQLLAVAILQVKGLDTLEFHHRSFAYRLSKKTRGEFLYEDWYEAHSRFLEEARKAAKRSPNCAVIRTDIESYYSRIRQNNLIEELIHGARIYHSRLSDITRLLIERKFDWEENLGIPQGHAMSGVISNIYLHKIDKRFNDKQQFDIEYFRYVDDITIVCKPEQTDLILRELDSSLNSLGLTRSKDENGKKGKTRIQTADDFLSQTEKDSVLEVLSKEHIRLLREIYKLDDKHHSLCQENWWEFLQRYQAILSRLSVFINVPRLSRKIKANQSWWNQTFSFWKRTKLPYVAEMKDLDDIEKWVEAFADKNPEWILQRQLLQENLQKMFHEGLDTLQNSDNESELANAQTKIKFASYRLGQLGFGDCAEDVANIIIERPWLVNVRRITQALALQNHENLLIKIYSETPDDKAEWRFIKSSALKSLIELSNITETTITLLSQIIVSESSILERTTAAEILLLRKNIQNLHLKNLDSALANSINPYLSKNLILLAKKFTPEALPQDMQIGFSDIINEVIQFGKLKYGLEELYRHEPDILKDYYYGDYPDNSKEFRDPAT
ncbi:MAG: hypothetical protein FD146_2398 [Anaerolineaceae bacterium]|nr:MAG: hypothetical protein FD146_2398 [Anaerolineaceae bacterium]